MSSPVRIRLTMTALLVSCSLVACGATPVTPSANGIRPASPTTGSPVAPVTSQRPETTSVGADLVPPDSPTPASGVCPRAAGAQVVITANPDTPAPRCVIVTSSQHLKVINASRQLGQPGRTITVSFARFPPRQVAVGASTTFDQSFGSYLAPGVHDLHVSLYSGSAEIWLR
jgi:hypothetical protein